MEYTIAHVGAFDFENYGDLLFTDVLKKQLEKRIKIKEIIYFAPKSCKMPNREEYVYSVTKLQQFVESKKIDAIVVGGGDLVHLQMIKTYMPHISAEWVDYEVLYMWVIPSIVAQKYNIPLLWNAPGVPLHFTEVEKKAVSWLCDCVDYISVRDYEARKELAAAVSAERIKVVPDTVLSIVDLLKKDELELKFDTMNLDIEKKRYVFFQCNVFMTDQHMKSCAEALIKIKKETEYKVVLQPIGYSVGDEEVMEKFSQLYPNEFIYYSKHFDQYEILTLIANSALYIGTSLHGCITANSYEVNNIIYNINHYNKIDGFIEMIDGNIVYRADEIMDAYHNLKSVSHIKIRKCICEIENHFDKIANLICKEKGQIYQNSNDLAEYIYKSNMNNIIFTSKIKVLESQIQEMAKNIETQQKNIEAQQKDIEAQQKNIEAQHEIIEEITNSTSWKLTEPIRKLLDCIKKRR